MNTPPQDAPDDGPRDATSSPHRSTPETSIGRWERGASVAFGGALLALGAKRRSLGGAASALAGGWLVYRGVSGDGSIARTLGGHTTSDRDRGEPGSSSDPIEVEGYVTVGRPADDLSRFWRDPAELTRIMGDFAEVTARGEDRHRWTVPAPLGRSVSWETRIVEDRPGELLRWESLEGATVPNEGSVHFHPAPADRGTEVTLRLRIDPPGGALGAAATRVVGIVPRTLANGALDRFKSLAETGEIPTLERNPSARGRGDLL